MRKYLSFVLLLLFVASATGQREQGRPRPFPFPSNECAPNDRLCQEQKRKRDKEENEKRQADLKRDTDKLFELATQLKAAVDKSNENMLSVEVVRKAEEIEKLAHSVKNKMKGE